MFNENANDIQSVSGKEKPATATTRRQFGTLGLVAAACGLAGSVSAAVPKTKIAEPGAMIATGDGNSRASFFHPASGQHRGLVMWGADGAASQSVAREMAAQGWAVLLVHDAIDDQRVYQQARTYVAWLEQQDCVASTGQSESDGGALGFGYRLRTVGAALPRFGFSTVAQREQAALAATLFAVPDAVLPARKAARLTDAARLMHRRLA